MQKLKEEYLHSSDNQPDADCGHCGVSLTNEHKFCPHCGFPQQGTREDQKDFRAQVFLKKQDLTNAQSKVKNAAATLYVIAGFTSLYGLIVGLGIREDAGLMIGNVVIAILYILLGLWSQEKPFMAILSGLILYATFILLNAFLDPATLYNGMVIKLVVIVFLIKGVVSARQANRILSELPTEKRPQFKN